VKKAVGSLLATALGLILLVYTGARSYDFVVMTLDPSRQVLAFFALAALDGGLVAWLLNYLYGAKGGMQRAISILLVIVDFIGAMGMATADTLLNTGKAGMTAALDASTIQSIVLALSIIIALNVGATVAHHLTDPDTRRKMAEEEAQGAIDDAVIKKIGENTATLAAQLAQPLAQHYSNELLARNTSTIKAPKDAIKITLPVIPQALPVQLPVQDEEPEVNPTTRRKMQ